LRLVYVYLGYSAWQTVLPPLDRPGELLKFLTVCFSERLERRGTRGQEFRSISVLMY
jgi:hypothetical protein